MITYAITDRKISGHPQKKSGLISCWNYGDPGHRSISCIWVLGILNSVFIDLKNWASKPFLTTIQERSRFNLVDSVQFVHFLNKFNYWLYSLLSKIPVFCDRNWRSEKHTKSYFWICPNCDKFMDLLTKNDIFLCYQTIFVRTRQL